MHLHSALTFIFLFVSTALSSPLAEGGQSRHNYNLAGAYWEETNGLFYFDIAIFDVPAPSGQHGYSVFVTLDGIKCNSWFTAEITPYVTDGKTAYKAWTHWANEDPYPASLTGTIPPGHVIRLSLNLSSPASDYAFLENISTAQTDVRFNDALPRCSQIVTWGATIPDSEIGKPIPFDTVTVTNAMAGPSRGIYEAAGARTMDILQGRTAVTSVTTEGSSITIKRVG